MGEFISTIELHDLPRDMQLVARIIGLEGAVLLMQNLDGVELYIPSLKGLTSAMQRYVKTRLVRDEDGALNVHDVSRQIGVTPRHVRRLAREAGVI